MIIFVALCCIFSLEAAFTEQRKPSINNYTNSSTILKSGPENGYFSYEIPPQLFNPKPPSTSIQLTSLVDFKKGTDLLQYAKLAMDIAHIFQKKQKLLLGYLEQNFIAHKQINNAHQYKSQSPKTPYWQQWTTDHLILYTGLIGIGSSLATFALTWTICQSKQKIAH